MSESKPANDEDASIKADLEAMKLPRGGIGFSVSRGQLFKILFTAGMLALVIAVQKPCATSMSSFVTDFDHAGSGAQMPKPENVDVPRPAIAKDDQPDYYVEIHPGMTEAEIKSAIEKARAKWRGEILDDTGWFDWPAMFAAAASKTPR